jgi:hypothetical protein
MFHDPTRTIRDVTGHPIPELTISELAADTDQPGVFAVTLATPLTCMSCQHVSAQWQITIATATAAPPTGARRKMTEPGS